MTALNIIREARLTGLGLFLLLGLQLVEAGAYVLVFATAVSAVIRFHHYCGIGRKQTNVA
jgi:hypothetical protein